MLQRTTRFSRASAQRNVSNAPLSRFSFIFPSYSPSCSRAPFSTFSLRACSTSKLLPATTHDFQPVYRKNFSNIRAARLFSQEHWPALPVEQDVSRSTQNVPTFLAVLYLSSYLSSCPGAPFSTCFARTRFGRLLYRKIRKIFISTICDRCVTRISNDK